MKRFLIALIGLSISITNGFTQGFVELSNNWIIDKTCYAQGEFFITSVGYFFHDETIVMEGREYFELRSTREEQTYPFGKYFRSNDDQVYIKFDEAAPEYLAYDFSLEAGEQITIGQNETTYIVTNTDFIELDNGELRKRLRIVSTEDSNLSTYWIDGIGGILSPMNPIYMFNTDCSNQLGCFANNDVVKYSEGSCMITSIDQIQGIGSSIKVHPNPANKLLFVEGIEIGKMPNIRILNSQGKAVITLDTVPTDGIPLGQLSVGLYFLEVTHGYRKRTISKFLKQ